jgi:hypothetical protein
MRPGAPWEQAYIESFHDKLRDECLNREVFYSLLEAKLILEQWRIEYNQRPATPRPLLSGAVLISSAGYVWLLNAWNVIPSGSRMLSLRVIATSSPMLWLMLPKRTKSHVAFPIRYSNS